MTPVYYSCNNNDSNEISRLLLYYFYRPKHFPPPLCIYYKAFRRASGELIAAVVESSPTLQEIKESIYEQ